MLRLLILVLVLPFSLAACSSGGTDGSASPTQPSNEILSQFLASPHNDGAILQEYADAVGLRLATNPVDAEYGKVKREVAELSLSAAYEQAIETSIGTNALLFKHKAFSSLGSGNLAVGVGCLAPRKVYFVNGVLNTKPEAIASGSLLRQRYVSKFGASEADGIDWSTFYNPSGKDGLSELAIAYCLIVKMPYLFAYSAWAALLEAVFIQPWFSAYEDYLNDVVECLVDANPLFSGFEGVLQDFPEAAVQELQNKFLEVVGWQPSSDAVANALAGSIQQDVQSGSVVVVVAHSQGNYIAEAALRSLSADELQSVGFILVASPTKGDTVPSSIGAKQSFTLFNDAILDLGALQVPTPPGPNLSNVLSNNSISAFEFSAKVAIHSIDDSYLGYSSSRDPILNEIMAQFSVLQNETELAGQGIIQATATWSPSGDIDLHVFEPDGTHVYYDSQQGSSGELDVDDIRGDGPENYFVCEKESLVDGIYSVFINNYNAQTGTNVTVRLKAGAETMEFQLTVGVANQGDTLIPVGSIHVQDGVPSIALQLSLAPPENAILGPYSK